MFSQINVAQILMYYVLFATYSQWSVFLYVQWKMTKQMGLSICPNPPAKVKKGKEKSEASMLHQINPQLTQGPLGIQHSSNILRDFPLVSPQGMQLVQNGLTKGLVIKCQFFKYTCKSILFLVVSMKILKMLSQIQGGFERKNNDICSYIEIFVIYRSGLFLLLSTFFLFS